MPGQVRCDWVVKLDEIPHLAALPTSRRAGKRAAKRLPLPGSLSISSVALAVLHLRRHRVALAQN
jgi:hypothetical protein